MAPSGWRRFKLLRGQVLSAHPWLPVCQVQRGALQLTLVGFLLDPHRPAASDSEILNALAARAAGPDDLPRLCDGFGGRWALFAESPQRRIVFADAFGLRQVHYGEVRGVRFCASSVPIIAAHFGLTADERGREFLDSPYVRRNKEFWWPGGATQYAAVRCLLPNHLLSMDDGATERFWPRADTTFVENGDVAAECAGILQGMVDAAARRFPLALPLTAGWDSRTILAAARRHAASLPCYTIRFPGYPERHQDLRIAQALARRLGLNHQVVRAADRMSEGFREVYLANTDPAHDEAGALAEGLASAFPAGHVSLSGHCSEVTRCVYYRSAAELPRSVEVGTLQELVHMSDVSLARDEFSRWLRGAQALHHHAKLSPLDLFYWEQRVGRWAANGQAQWDLVHDRVSPFACRELMVRMLSTAVEDRKPPHIALYRRMIEALWPELLDLPFNPDVDASARGASARVRTFGARLRDAVLHTGWGPLVKPEG
jgi:hypothetical protein